MASNGAGRRKKAYSQAERVLELYQRLERSDAVRMSEAKALKISARTLQRDIEVLRAVFPDIKPVHGPDPGWRLQRAARSWKKPSAKLMMGLALSVKVLRFMSRSAFDKELRPLLSELREKLPTLKHLELRDLERRVYLVERGHKLYVHNERLLQVLDEMVKALLAQKPADVAYLSPTRKLARQPIRRLRVQVLCLTIYRGAIYFVVDVLSGDWSSPERRIQLAVDRLQSVQVDTQARAHAYPKDFAPEKFFESAFGIMQGGILHRVQLLVSPTRADEVRERAWQESEPLQTLSDGSVRLCMQLGALEEVTEWVLGMGEHVRVEGPPELIERVKTRLAKALASYA